MTKHTKTAEEEFLAWSTARCLGAACYRMVSIMGDGLCGECAGGGDDSLAGMNKGWSQKSRNGVGLYHYWVDASDWEDEGDEIPNVSAPLYDPKYLRNDGYLFDEGERVWKYSRTRPNSGLCSKCLDHF